VVGNWPDGEASSGRLALSVRVKPRKAIQMSKSTMLLIAAVVPLLASACTTGGAQSMTTAQRDDVAYCRSLVSQYTTYVGSVGGSLGGNSDRGGRADLDAKVAIAQCQESNTGPAIPVLEQKLRDAKVAVPPRAP
jgi:hypothetical protein